MKPSRTTILIFVAMFMPLFAVVGTTPAQRAYAADCAWSRDGATSAISTWASVFGEEMGPVARGEARVAIQGFFDPAISKQGELAPGALGLPGEQIMWAIGVTNHGTAPGSEIVITDVVRNELRIDSVVVERGSYAINDQIIVFMIPELNPGESVQMWIETTVLQSPVNSNVVNEAHLVGRGPNGTVVENAAAEVFVPVGLPATGYPPVELPGEGEPSVWVVGLLSLTVVAMVARIVWRRGRWM